jgi:two-component system chemotaxis response regulator CheB
MSKIRVAIVDDSSFVRAALARIIAADARFEVIGQASDGRSALELVGRLRPDVVTMDYNMPGMAGDEVVRQILAKTPTPIVMVSAHTTEGARATVNALAAGALDVVAKPGGEVSMDLGKIAGELLEKLAVAAKARPQPIAAPAVTLRSPTINVAPAIGAVSSHGDEPPSSQRYSAPPASVRQPIPTPLPGSVSPISVGRTTLPSPVPTTLPSGGATGSTVAAVSTGAIAERVVVIGSSTGGPAALDALFRALPASPNFGLVVVQHMATTALTGALAARLSGYGNVQVREAVDGDRPRVGLALVAPGGRHLSFVAGGAVRLTDDPPIHGVRPAVDIAMKTAATAFGARCVGVVLTGMGRDGALGLAAIKTSGGRTLAQDQATSVVYGMPKAAAELGVVDDVVALPNMVGAILRALAR